MPHTKAADVTFLKLFGSVFCVECELISYNNSPQCLACGSRALLSLSRVMGGSLAGDRASIVSNDALDRVVENVLRSALVPEVSTMPDGSTQCSKGLKSNMPAGLARLADEKSLEYRALNYGVAWLQTPIRKILERAYALTPARGAVLALRWQQKLICVAAIGNSVPELGSEIYRGWGFSGLCVKTATPLRCDFADYDSRVDRQSCRELGVQSIVAAPLFQLNDVLGLLEIFSGNEYAFDDRDMATVQLLASILLMVLLQSSGSTLPGIHSLPQLHTDKSALSESYF